LALGLFYASVASLTVNTLGRIGVILKTRGSGWRNVKDELKGDFLLGAAMFMIVAPSIGMARMKSTLEDKNTGGTAIGRGAITSAGVAKRDAVASEALSAYVAGLAEVRTAVILIATQDVFELSVQLLFALLVSKQADLSALFWISTLGTVLHMLQHGVEAWLTWRTLPKLRMKGEGRDHVFDADCDASTLGKAVNEFAVKHGRHVRKVVLRDCKELDDTGKPKTFGREKDVWEPVKKKEFAHRRSSARWALPANATARAARLLKAERLCHRGDWCGMPAATGAALEPMRPS